MTAAGPKVYDYRSVAEIDFIVVGQGRTRGRHRYAVNRGAMGRAFVDDPQAVAVPVNTGMHPRETAVVDDHIGVAGAAQRQAASLQKHFSGSLNRMNCERNLHASLASTIWAIG